MKGARRSYGPEILQVLRKAFDDAWREVSSGFEPPMAEAARYTLVQAILAYASPDSTDSEELKNQALRIMAFNYPEQLGAKF